MADARPPPESPRRSGRKGDEPRPWDESGWLGPFKGLTDRQSRNFLIFRFGDMASVALRPSGTEPKAKAYVEACSSPKQTGLSDADWAAQCREVDARCKAIADAFVKLCTS